MRVLVFRGGALGDLILTLPVLRALREQWREARIAFFGAFPQALLAHPVWTDEVYDLNGADTFSLFRASGAVSKSLCHRLQNAEVAISYLADPAKVFENRLVCAGVKSVVRGPYQLEAGPTHAVEQLATPLRALGLRLMDPVPRLHQSHGERSGALALHLGSGSARKNWPVAQWLRLVSAIGSEFSEICLIEGEADEALTAAFMTACRAPQLRRWKSLSLEDLATALTGVEIFVGNDSGISHLAAAAGVPSVVLFGPTDPDVWRPRGSHVRTIRSGDKTMSGIEAESVCKLIRQVRQQTHPIPF